MTKFNEGNVPDDFEPTSSSALDDEFYSGAERRRVPRAMPVPEVVETNDADAWAMWQESVTQIDSQLPTQPAPLEGPTETGEGDVKDPEIDNPNDPFASVHRRSS